MIRRVYENQHGIITLDSDIFGTRKRISTGKKGDNTIINSIKPKSPKIGTFNTLK